MDHTFPPIPPIPGFSRLSASAQGLVRVILAQPALYHMEHTIPLPLPEGAPLPSDNSFQEAIAFLRSKSVPCSFFDMCDIELFSNGRAAALHLRNKQPFHRKQAVNAITRELCILTDGLMQDSSQAARFYRLYQRITSRYRYLDHPLSHSIYGLVSEKAGVCQAVANMLCLCCSVLGIESSIVESQDHCWNLITLDGNTAHFDCTWDLGETPLTGFKHYGLSSKEIELLPDHQAVSGTQAAPESARLNWYDRKHLICTPSSAAETIRRQIKRNGVATCRLPGISHAEIEQLLYRALQDVAVGGFSFCVDALNTVTVHPVSAVPGDRLGLQVSFPISGADPAPDTLPMAGPVPLFLSRKRF